MPSGGIRKVRKNSVEPSIEGGWRWTAERGDDSSSEASTTTPPTRRNSRRISSKSTSKSPSARSRHSSSEKSLKSEKTEDERKSEHSEPEDDPPTDRIDEEKENKSVTVDDKEPLTKKETKREHKPKTKTKARLKTPPPPSHGILKNGTAGKEKKIIPLKKKPSVWLLPEWNPEDPINKGKEARENVSDSDLKYFGPLCSCFPHWLRRKSISDWSKWYEIHKRDDMPKFPVAFAGLYEWGIKAAEKDSEVVAVLIGQSGDIPTRCRKYFAGENFVGDKAHKPYFQRIETLQSVFVMWNWTDKYKQRQIFWRDIVIHSTKETMPYSELLY